MRWDIPLLALFLALATPPVRSAPLGEILVDLDRSYYTLGSQPTYLGTVGGKAIFVTRGEPNAFAWITDGTPEGTKPLEIWTSGEVYAPGLLPLGTAGTHCFLLARYQGPSHDAILAIDDQGVVTRVLESGETWNFDFFDPPSNHRVVGRRLALSLQNQAAQEQVLAFIDGDTLATDVALTSTTGGFELLGAIGNELAFSRRDYEAELSTLWRSGGTAETTYQYATLPAFVDADRAASGDGILYFSAQGSIEVGVEAWATNLTAPGTAALTALVDPGARIGEFHVDGDRAFFVVEDATIGQELFSSDGRPSGTRAVTNFGYHLPFGYDEATIAVSEQRAFFVATDGLGSYRLWLAGDRPETTRSLVEDVQFDSTRHWIAEAGGSVFVATSDSLGHSHLFVSDGTEAGTHEVETGCSDECGLFPEPLTSTASTFYFTSRSAASIQETLYATRPPFSVATSLFEALKEGPIIDYSTSRSVAIVGERVYFAAGQYVPGASGTWGEPWATAGTPATTGMIRRLAALQSSTDASRFRTTAGALAFAVDLSYPGRVLRRSSIDGEIQEVQGDYDPCFYSRELYALTGRFIFEDCQDDFWALQASGGPATRLTDFNSNDFSRSAANEQIVAVLLWNGSGYEAWRVGDPGPGATLAQSFSPEEANGALKVAADTFLLIRDLDPQDQLFSLGSDLSQFAPISPVFDAVDNYIGSAQLGRGFFGANEPGGETRVWTTDGTAAGTRSLFSAAGYRLPVDAIRSAGEWIVLAATYTAGLPELEVWRTDGTPAGSMMLSSMAVEGNVEDSRVAALPGRFLFTGRTPVNEAELWSIPTTGGAATALLPPGVALRAGSPSWSAVADRLFFTACDADHGCELWVSVGTPETTRLFQDIRPGAASSTPDQLLAVGNELVFTADDGLHGVEPWHVVLDGGDSCRAGHGALCLDGGRFLVRALWKAPIATVGDAGEVPLTPDTGAFWFFDPDNVELVVKAIDGGGTNGHEWLFYGALSNVEYSLDVTDSLTGEARRYFNPAGRFASAGDILAFPIGESAAELSAFTFSGNPGVRSGESSATRDPAGPSGVCGATESRFCILEGRFAVEATWRDFQGRTGTARSGSLTDDTGYFWFFDEANVEIVVKAIDGSAYNDHFWIYYGALSNVEYTIRVTDTVTNAVREYRNSLGTFGSFGDISAFPAD